VAPSPARTIARRPERADARAQQAHLALDAKLVFAAAG